MAKFIPFFWFYFSRKHVSHNYIEADSSSDSSFEDRESYKKQLKLQDEIKCLEKTLFKRQAQLKDAGIKLREYEENLNDAKLQVQIFVIHFHLLFNLGVLRLLSLDIKL